MTASEADQALGAYLQTLRTQAGLPLDLLARRVSLSKAQLAQLENGEVSLFYTRRIRLQAARKVILHLGGDPARACDDILRPRREPPPPPLPEPVREGNVPPDHDPPAVPAVSRPRWRLGVTLAGLTGGLIVPLSLHFWPADAAEPSTGLDAPAASPATLATAAPSTLEPVAEAAPAQPVAESSNVPVCPPAQGPLPTFQPQQASKPGNVVYLLSPVRLQVCLTDARGEVQVSHLEAGQGRSFYGQPPWQVHSPELQRLEMYFQGWRVRLPAQAQDAVQLVELR